ncbi:hypothetical protein BCL57_000193 [Agromyces flavus]|uniref:Uncharacterized protein n=2 Tax=Agromyces flavus TaxID=589382 RepID=A0ABT1KGN7_9MICO|nr:hypothetical protein [Agromyces flavus]MCP2366051.1 hypothetical protein [Agromyces flavus]GGI43901.1 hypothetical protein GCM10010932_01910 [Agromyces flavus]
MRIPDLVVHVGLGRALADVDVHDLGLDSRTPPRRHADERASRDRVAALDRGDVGDADGAGPVAGEVQRDPPRPRDVSVLVVLEPFDLPFWGQVSQFGELDRREFSGWREHDVVHSRLGVDSHVDGFAPRVQGGLEPSEALAHRTGDDGRERRRGDAADPDSGSAPGRPSRVRSPAAVVRLRPHA